MGLNRLVISAPFGNYIRPRGATATLGTFTLRDRPGRWWKVLTTVRPKRRTGAWVNKLGLRNPGIGWLEDRIGRGREDVADRIVSVHGFDEAEWQELLGRVSSLAPEAVELNMSCPNVGEISRPSGLFARAMEAMGEETSVIVKLPPVRFEAIAESALEAGVRAFHCCNTLPVPEGGMSGKPLMPHSLGCIGAVRVLAATRGIDGLTIIGGGGITSEPDIDEYARAGATHVALGTKVMHPKYLWSDAGVRPLIDHADRRLGQAESAGDSRHRAGLGVESRSAADSQSPRRR